MKFALLTLVLSAVAMFAPATQAGDTAPKAAAHSCCAKDACCGGCPACCVSCCPVPYCCEDGCCEMCPDCCD